MLQTVLDRLKIKGKSLLPIVQGGMGVGVSAHRLAGSVAALDAFGTISSVDLRRHHPDLMIKTGKSRDRALIDAANLEALDREVKAAHKLANGKGMVGVNIMRAVSEYASYVRQACESGADAVVVGAGLPLDLPELTSNFSKVAIIPILSDVRGIGLVLKKWMRKQRLPDAIVIENPKYAAGHLGAPTPEGLNNPNFAFPHVLEGTRQLFKDLGLESENIPLIAAGGVNSHEQVRLLMGMGANAVQLGSAFAVTEEGDAHPNFKKVLVEARPEDIVTFMSVAGLPARAVRTPWLASYLAREEKLQRAAKQRPCTVGFDCLVSCGLRDGIAKHGQFCIDTRLAFALAGDIERGLFFRGSEKLPFGNAIRSVRELADYLLNGVKPVLNVVSRPTVHEAEPALALA
ncbi:nitronate monooxygenase family protein [Pusillimonas sp. ANT_WB101]|uniref:NAD(P)H-dependent flavin oxidoreductase n=1 Tax=Pusillimonas sp. ANT_WB101 TaxID=2597356 RepID=UPI0011ED8024|nr:nitronate monooxygenase family protein [Pusillimonas sp. ANT_WB101]KAA0911559.1 nitronate monooxygenase [Pusillimonas sp. ANT_WB101]